jgi:hypothetical protein
MSKRRNALLPRYCKARGPLMGWRNTAGTQSSVGAPSKRRAGKRKKRKGSPLLGPTPATVPGKKSRPLSPCPDCGCLVRRSRMGTHLGRCPKRSGVGRNGTIPPPGTGVSSAPASPRPRVLPSRPTETPRQRLKRDNILRSGVLRECKELRRRLAGLPLGTGIATADLCRLIDGRFLSVEGLIRSYLDAQGRASKMTWDGETFTAYRKYVGTAVRGWEPDRLPLRPGVVLLSADARAALAAAAVGSSR